MKTWIEDAHRAGCLLSLCGGVCLCLLAPGAGRARTADWNQWGRTPARNMVSEAEGLPTDIAVGDGRLTPERMRNVRWAVRLGSHTYGNPVVAGDRIYVGTNDVGCDDPRLRRTGGGLIRCLDRATGRSLWTLPIPRFRTSDRDFNFDDMGLGVCSSPTVEGDRLYVVSNRGAVLCLDTAGQANGNDGPFQDEARFITDGRDPDGPLSGRDGDILWRFDMVAALPCQPQDAASSAILIHGDFLYVGTSNGVDRSHRHVPYPDAPSLIVLDKRSGRLVGRDREGVGHRLFHGQWSSPALGIVGGQAQIVYGAGDGVVYAFAPLEDRPPAGEPRTLACIWSCDCTPSAYREHPYQRAQYHGWNSDFYGRGPSEIIGTPVCHGDRVYVTVGQDTRHGRGAGAVTCIDATGRGDVTASHRRWQTTTVDRSLSTPAVSAGVVYVPDFSGRLHALDADTGRTLWVQDMQSPLWSSPLVADGKVYLGTEKQTLWILHAGREREVLNRVRFPHRIYSSALAVGDVLYVATERALYALAEGGGDAGSAVAVSPTQ